MRVEQYNQVIDVAKEIGTAKGLYFILRLQSRKDIGVHINNGKTEEISSGNLEGMGLQTFTPEGYIGFAAADRISTEVVKDLFDKAAYLAEQSRSFGGEPNVEIFKLKEHHTRREIKLENPYGSLSLMDIETRLKEMNNELTVIDPRLSVRTLLRLTDEEWRIIRSDGTDTVFNTPRSMLYHSITAKSHNDTATTFANLPGTDLGVLIKQENIQKIQKRAKKATQLALDLLSAPKLAGGHYKLVIDYALAKGLAHEAFGHAAETDSIESSILGENGRFKTGMTVADSDLSIIDGPLEGDYAYQPISAVGEVRQTVRIVDHGKLNAGLSDIFSANRAGVPYTGAERIENFFHLPIARMSNIRIEMERPFPLNQDFESVTPKDLYRILLENQLMKADENVIYLAGFQGGQVNPAFGDFVFHCSGIYQLSPEPVLYKPAIFSGKILSVLKSVKAAIGQLQIDAIGTCGKMGQGVPSCGGSHYFLVIEQNPEVTIGGK
ncbi:MAG TPA: TldD/PmbA family protein [Bacillota bacterium]|nr:TldD/PmbA family protein [Bacillota bacterium]